MLGRLVRTTGAVVLTMALLAAASTSDAQSRDPPSPPHWSEGEGGRPGLFRAGAWYFTPYLHIGSLGVDTNVFYTATDRQADFIASGGPGLEIVRPFGMRSRFLLDGGVSYLWFARTEAQRRLNWYGSASLELEGVKTSLLLEERYTGRYSRPNFEVDTRVQQDTEGTLVRLTRRLGDRWALSLLGSRQTQETEDQEYLGTNLGETLSSRRYRAGGELRRALSVKTMLVGGGEQGWHRFPRLPERDGESTLGYGGFRTDASALISGHLLVGYRWFWLDTDPAGDRSTWYTDTRATLNVSPKTKLGTIYLHDLDYTSFASHGPSPTVPREQLTIFFDKILASNLYLYLFGRLTQYKVDDIVLAPPPGSELAETNRNDRVQELGAELGYQFRSRIRIGVSAIYSERRSNIETFGIEGLVVGFKVTYNPPQPVVR